MRLPHLLVLLLLAACKAPPTSPERAGPTADDLIARGAALCAEQRFEEAQSIYSTALELYPEDWRLLRYRGHRWITLRRFDKALADLERAWELCASAPDAPEPDSAPPASTKGNVIYHLALAHYLRGEFAEAAATWDAGGGIGDESEDRLCSSSYWHQLALRRAGRDEAADALLRELEIPAAVQKNESYRQLCLLFRGERTPEQVLDGVEPGGNDFATRGYGVACWYRFRGEDEESRRLLEKITARGPRIAFGCIAAEVDLSMPSAR